MHPVAANLLHHAIAMFLISAICAHTARNERDKLGYDLNRIWKVFKGRLRVVNGLDRFDETMRALHEFETIRSSQTMVREATSGLSLDEIESLMKAICGASVINKAGLNPRQGESRTTRVGALVNRDIFI